MTILSKLIIPFAPRILLINFIVINMVLRHLAWHTTSLDSITQWF